MNRRRIMIVDDDAESLNMMMKQLDVLYDVIGFSSGESAIEALDRAPAGRLPELILLDIIMNGMDGYEVLARFKKNEKYRSIPVVFLTGMTDELSEIRGLEMDAVDYLKKPIAGKVLFARVQHYLDLYADSSAKGKLDEEKLKSLQEPLTDREL